MTTFSRASPDPALQALQERPHWFAVRTRSRSEKKVVELLGRNGLEAYCPLREEERRWTDRVKRVSFPLFPGYVFSRGALDDVTDVLRTPGVVNVVREHGRPVPVREEELEAVRRFEAGLNETGHVPEPANYLEPGDEVVVASGPFKGLRGVLLERRGRLRVAVRVHALRAAMAVEMEREVIKPAA